MVPLNSNGLDKTLIRNHKINGKLALLTIWDADLVKGSFLEEVTAKLRQERISGDQATGEDILAEGSVWVKAGRRKSRRPI